jgi:hypothetical protein
MKAAQDERASGGLTVESMSRKRVLINLLTVPIVTAAIVATLDSASADTTVDPSTVQYQTHPNNGQQCSDCEQFIPAKTDPTKNNGTCKTVKGAISPQGWCQLYSLKSK